MGRVNRFRHWAPAQAREMLYALGPAFGLRLFLLTPKAYWSRVRARQSPFAPTLYERQRTLPRASLEGRVLSQEPYLRPTAHCDSHAPEVIALADQLRHRSGRDWEYAQAVYDFVRNEIAHAFEPGPHRGVVGTLEAGCGICVDQGNLLVALARAGGIPARYCTIGLSSVVEAGWVSPRDRLLRHFFEDLEASTDGLLKKIGADLRRALEQGEKAFCADNFPKDRLPYHPIVELKISDFWIPADPTLGDAEAAALCLPLPRLGYDPLMLWGFMGGVIGRSEEIPLGRSYWMVRHLLCLLARGALDYVNRRFEEERTRGRQILAEVGRAEYIHRRRRFYMPVPGLTELGVPPLL